MRQERQSSNRIPLSPLRAAPRACGFIAAMILVGFLFPDDARACTKPKTNDPPRMWVLPRGADVTITVRGYRTFDVAPGTICACGLRALSALTAMTGVKILDAETQQSLFTFTASANTGAGFAAAEGERESWVGFSSSATTQAIPANRTVDLVFTGTLASGADAEQLMSQLRENGKVGTDQGVNGGGLSGIHTKITSPPRLVDLAPTGPVGVLTSMTLGAHGAIVMEIQDADDGISTLRMVGASNLHETMTFSPGTHDAVAVTVERVDERLPAFARIEACNTRGECSRFEPRLLRLAVGESGQASKFWPLVGVRLGRIAVEVGALGAERISLFANGLRTAIRSLPGGQAIELDLPLLEGRSGRSGARLEVEGPAGTSVDLGFLGLP